MKNTLIFTILLLLLANFIIAQKPQVILGIAKENKTIEYYENQYDLWDVVTQKDPKNGFAWRQKYLAKRAFLQKTKPEVWKNNKPAIYAELDIIIQKAKKYIDHTFEYYFIKSNNTSGKESVEYSQKAYELDPERTETYGWLFVDAVANFKNAKAQEIGHKMLANNIYSHANLIWNLNALNSMEKDAVFIGNGDMDILPKWVLQYGDYKRNDILVVSVWRMINDEKYYNRIINEVGMTQPNKTQKDFQNAAEYVEYLMLELLKNGKRKTYMTSGSNVKFFNKYDIADKMYQVGTVMVYSENRFDNNRVLRENLKNYYMDHILQNYQMHPEDEIIDTHMHLIYLASIMNAMEYYEKNKMESQVEYYRKLIKAIAAKSGRENEILGWYTPKS